MVVPWRPMGTTTTTMDDRAIQAQVESEGKCGARKKPGRYTAKHGPAGAFCQRPAGSGTDHVGSGRCKHHGGATASGKTAAKHQQAAQAVEAYGLPVETTPEQALMDELHRSAGHVAWLGGIVRELEAPAEGGKGNGGNMVGPVGGAQGGYPEYKPSVWIELYRAERKHLGEVAAACIKAGIEERRVRVAEQTGQLIAEVIKGILTDLGVAKDPKVPGVVRKHLTAIQGGQA